MKVLILTEGGIQFGMGHITRCMALYEAFVEKGVETLIIVNGDETVDSLLSGANFIRTNWLKNEEETFDKLENYDIVVVDSYHADFEFYQALSQKVKVPVYFDDTIRLDYPGGIVINGAIEAEKLRYRKKMMLYIYWELAIQL